MDQVGSVGDPGKEAEEGSVQHQSEEGPLHSQQTRQNGQENPKRVETPPEVQAHRVEPLRPKVPHLQHPGEEGHEGQDEDPEPLHQPPHICPALQGQLQHEGLASQ